MDLALNNLQKLICHKTQSTNQLLKPYNFMQIICIKNNYFVAVIVYKGL